MWVQGDGSFEPFQGGALTGPLSPKLEPEGPPVAIVPASVALWHGARERGETGVEAASGWCGISLFEIPALPDFSASRFPDLAGLDAKERVQRVAERQSQLLAALYTLGPSFGFSLRYHCEKRPGQEARIRLFLIGRCFGRAQAEAVEGTARFREAVRRGFPAGYPLAEPAEPDEALTDSVLFPRNVRALAEILKPEQAIKTWHDPGLCGFSFYYYPLPFSPADNDMIGFCRALSDGSAGSSILLDVTLVPTLPLTSVERAELSTWGQIAEKWGRDQRLQLPGGLYSKAQILEVAADPHAGEAKKAYGDLLARYGTAQSRLFLYAVRVLVQGERVDTDFAGDLASALAARALAPGTSHQMRLLGAGHPAFERALRAVHFSYVTPAVCNEALWQHPEAPETLRRLHRMAELREIAPFFRLPIPGRDGCPGVPLDSGLPQAAGGSRVAAAGGPSGLNLGRFIESARVTAQAAAVPLAELAKHALIVGTPGSGKTNLCFSLLLQLWRDHRIPFLVLEPAKTEYRALLDAPGMEELLVFTVGSERVSPLRLNPLEVLGGVPVAEHIAALTACFQGAFSLPDPLPMLLDQALREVYADKGWSEYGIGGEDPELEPPTLSDLYHQAVAVAERSRYAGEVAGNIRAALETRIGALLRGPKGRCFGARRSVPVSLLMERPVVLELESLSDEEKALTMMLLLVFVREQVRATRRSGAKLAHVVLVEEAHNLLGSEDTARGGANGADPRGVAIRYFVRMLAEMRALGEGLLIADQLPTALAPEAVKNTNLKVMHRLTAADDREVLGQTMALDPGQKEQAATLSPGLSFVFQEGWARARMVRKPSVKEEMGLAEPPEDAAVREGMAAFADESAAVREAFLPFAGCGSVCRRCDARLRERNERWAKGKLLTIEAAIRSRPQDAPEAVALIEYRDGLEIPEDDLVAHGCALIHFVERVCPALPGTDVR